MNMSRSTITRFLAAALLSALSSAAGAASLYRIHVGAAESNLVDIPLATAIDLPPQFSDADLNDIGVELRREGDTDEVVPGQLVRDTDGKIRLCWVLPADCAALETDWRARLFMQPSGATGGFQWDDAENPELRFNDRPIVRYMQRFDDSTPETLLETYKPYHHVLDESGHPITKGPGGLYTHHRGLFIGFNALRCKDRSHDFWHMKQCTQRHKEMLEKTAGPVLGRTRALIHWVDDEGDVIIAERRRLTAFHLSDQSDLLLEFRTDLTAVADDVQLDGDPEHAGFQFRAHNDIAEGADEVKAKYLFHADGIDPREDRNLPWAAMSIVLRGRTWGIEHMNLPGNPQPIVYSAYRDYGRFGAFFKHAIGKGETLSLRFGVFITPRGALSREEAKALYEAMARPPKCEIVPLTR